MARVSQLVDGEMIDIGNEEATFGIAPRRPLARDRLVSAAEAQAWETPKSTRTWYRVQALGYSILHQRAKQLAPLIRQKGISRRDLVALVLPRSAEEFDSPDRIIRQAQVLKRLLEQEHAK